MPAPNRYDLVAAIGLSPQVLTETIYALARTPEPAYPASVHIVTTTTGEAFVQAGLFGETRFYNHNEIKEAAPRWERLWETLGHPPPPLQVHVPTDAAGHSLADIRSAADDQAFANTCYDVVRGLTAAPERFPLVGSIAGGRKTMSAHLQTAFALFTSPEDRLLHVLVSPATLEQSRTFYWPTPDTPDARLDLIEMPYPRLAPLLEEPFQEHGPEAGALDQIRRTLARYHALRTPPSRLTLTFRDRDLGVTLHAPDGTTHACALSPRLAAFFLVFLDFQLADPEGVTYQTLHSQTAHARRLAVLNRLGSGTNSRWTYKAKDAMKCASDFGLKIAATEVSPYVAQYLRLEKAVFPDGANKEDGRGYRIQEPLPPITLEGRPPTSWPFDHLKWPVRT